MKVFFSHIDMSDIERRIVVLDQNALSNLTEKHCEEHDEWRQIKQLCIEGVDKGTWMFPITFESLLESYKIPREDKRNEVIALLKYLSCGYKVRPLQEIIAREILSHVRPSVRVEGVDKANPEKIPEKDTNSLSEEVRKAEDLTNSRIPKESKYPGKRDSLRLAHTWIEEFRHQIVEILFALSISESERNRLISFVENDNKPLSIAKYLYFRLFTQHFVDRRSVERVNLFHDIYRMAMALFCAEAFITEKYLFSAVTRSGLLEIPDDTVVLNIADTQTIICWLEKESCSE